MKTEKGTTRNRSPRVRTNCERKSERGAKVSSGARNDRQGVVWGRCSRSDNNNGNGNGMPHT